MIANPIASILGDSESMMQLRQYLPLVARNQASVLITGETGTGKERIAEAIHQLSSRHSAPFIPINCTALPESLVESELFGHERGAFTGAVTTHPGKAAEANGGTLFLDEIGEMPAYAQAKLLRFLETGNIDRVGASNSIHVNVRIIAATNQVLEELIQLRTFRADLYYRLNVARIEVEPLRSRPEDIEPLIESFIDHFNNLYNLSVGPPDAELLNIMQDYNWPGNVRELRNMVESTFIDPPQGLLQLHHLPLAFRRLFSSYKHSVPDEKELLIAALRKTQWNKTEAAKMLNLSRMTLYRKIVRYQLEKMPGSDV